MKAPPGEYASVTGVEGSGVVALASLDLVIASGIAHEVRTTVHPALTRRPHSNGSRATGRSWRRPLGVQPFRATGCTNDALVSGTPHEATVDPALLALLRTHLPAVEVRG